MTFAAYKYQEVDSDYDPTFRAKLHPAARSDESRSAAPL